MAGVHCVARCKEGDLVFGCTGPLYSQREEKSWSGRVVWRRVVLVDRVVEDENTGCVCWMRTKLEDEQENHSDVLIPSSLYAASATYNVAVSPRRSRLDGVGADANDLSLLVVD